MRCGENLVVTSKGIQLALLSCSTEDVRRERAQPIITHPVIVRFVISIFCDRVESFERKLEDHG